MTAALLPAAVRDAYGFRWTPAHEPHRERLAPRISLVWPLLPRVVRHAPLRASLRRA